MDLQDPTQHPDIQVEDEDSLNHNTSDNIHGTAETQFGTTVQTTSTDSSSNPMGHVPPGARHRLLGDTPQHEGTVRFEPTVTFAPDTTAIQVGSDDEQDALTYDSSFGRQSYRMTAGAESDSRGRSASDQIETVGDVFTIYDLEKPGKKRLEVWQGQTVTEIMRHPGAFCQRHMPIFTWLPNYEWGKSFGGDLISGLTLFSALLSEGMAYALLAGVGAEVGLYSSFIPVLIYSVFGTIRQLSIGPVSLTAVLTAVALSPLNELEVGVPAASEDEKIAEMVILTVLTGLFMLMFGLLNSGFLENVLSLPTRQGFITGVAVSVISHQMVPLLGAEPMEGEHTGIWHDFIYIPTMFRTAKWQSAVFGVGSLLYLLTMKWAKGRIKNNKWVKNFPGILLVLVVTVGLNSIIKMDEENLQVLGNVQHGPPRFTLPKVTPTKLQHMLGEAVIIALVGWIETVAVGREVSGHHQYPISANSEFVAMGMSNIGGSFFGCMPVSGSIGRTLLVSELGGETQMASVIAALLIFCSMFATKALYWFPKPVISAVIIYCVVSLIEYTSVKHMHRMRLWRDVGFYFSTLFLTLTIGLEQGLIVGAAISVIWVLRGSTTPSAHLMGCVPGSDVYQPLHESSRAQPAENVMVLKPGSDVMFYANAQSLKKRMHRLWEGRAPDGGLLADWMVNGVTAGIVLDMSDVVHIDITAVYILNSIVDTTKMNGVQIVLSGLSKRLRNQLVKGGLLKRIGRKHVTNDIARGVSVLQEAFERYDTYRYHQNDSNSIELTEAGATSTVALLRGSHSISHFNGKPIPLVEQLRHTLGAKVPSMFTR